MLVIIGLIVGGVLAGQDLIRAAYIRAQISQIEKYNAAANTFYGKYQALPGDLLGTLATQYGLAARAGTPGQGDGNGLLQAVNGANGVNTPNGLWWGQGEPLLFWEDLGSTGLIEGGFHIPYV